MSDDPQDVVHDVYADAKAKGAAAIYRDWAARYDADNAALGFRLPHLAAGWAARYVPRGAGPILDAGCGTGLVGAALRILGYDRITGLDLSPDMLGIARASGAYETLVEARLGDPLPFDDGTFAGVLCIGSFGPGHAPPASLNELSRVARPGVPVIFNLVEATWQDQGFPAVMEALTRSGTWTLEEDSGAFRPYHIGEQDLFCRTFVYRRT